MRILHVFRSPVGGLFRHVRDLARAQSQMGHEVGVLCSASDGGAAATQHLQDMQKHCSLGVHREQMSRLPGLGDFAGTKKAKHLAEQLRIEVIHCHGAKGGVYGRLAAARLGIPSVYTPHGGSLHYDWNSPAGALFLFAERFLARKTGGFCFVCDYEKREFDAKVGLAGRPAKVVLNGLWPEEFGIATPRPDATDFLFVGEIRHLKGVDILLHAMSKLEQASLTIVGDGKEMSIYQKLCTELGLDERVYFAGRRPIAEAMTLGRIMILPSRNESFPYVVLEAAAAHIPVVASAVGGIPEIVPQELLCQDRLPGTLAHKMSLLLGEDGTMKASEMRLFESVRRKCQAQDMAKNVTAFYADLKAARAQR